MMQSTIQQQGPKKHKGRALKTLTLWANSRDGREVLSLAGISPDKRTTECMVAFAAKGVPTTQLRKKETDQ